MNSPWNIAAAFLVDMSFSEKEICLDLPKSGIPGLECYFLPDESDTVVEIYLKEEE